MSGVDDLWQIVARDDGQKPVIWSAELEVYDTPKQSSAPSAKLILSVQIDDGVPKSIELPCTGMLPASVTKGKISLEGLTETVTLDIKLDAVTATGMTIGEAFAESGIAGVNPFGEIQTQSDASANLKSVRIVLRPKPVGADYSSEQPCFEILGCWAVTAVQKFQGAIKDAEGTAKTSVEFDVCLGFSLVKPLNFDLNDFQIRIDFGSFSLSTGWLKLPDLKLGVPGLPDLRIDGVLVWLKALFSKIGGINLPTLGFVLPDLGQFPVYAPRFDLPLGIAATTKITIERTGGLWAIEASANDFVLWWEGEPTQLKDFELWLRYERLDEDNSTCRASATFAKAQYPEPGGETGEYKFTLPFEVLELSADCWFLRLGLYFHNDAQGRWNACFEALLEIGGLTVKSELFDGSEEGLYHTDLRLLARDLRVMTNPMPPSGSGTVGFFEGVDNVIGAFSNYLDAPGTSRFTIPALSFATELGPQDQTGQPANDYGLEFLDGDFRAGERIFLAWRQQGLRFLRALAHDVIGTQAAGAAQAQEPLTAFGLEVTQHPGQSNKKQLRLDWRPDLPAPNLVALSGPLAETESDKCVDFNGGDLAFNVPLDGSGVVLTPPADAITFDLPALKLSLARPVTQSLVISHEDKDGQSLTDIVHLAHYSLPAAGSGTTGSARIPIFNAAFGFALSNEDGAREIVETKPDNGHSGTASESKPFLTVALGCAPTGQRLTLMTMGWEHGNRGPRFLRQAKDGLAIPELLPQKLLRAPTGDPGCPGAPPAPTPISALAFTDFESLSFGDGNSDWCASAQLLAKEQLFKLFGDGKDSKVRFKITHVCPVDDPKERSKVAIKTFLSAKMGAGFDAEGIVTFIFDTTDLSLRLDDGAGLKIMRKVVAAPAWADKAPIPGKPDDFLYAEPEEILGFSMIAMQSKVPGADGKPKPDPEQPELIPFLELHIDKGRFTFRLPEQQILFLRYEGLGEDALAFMVTNMLVGAGGVDLEATLVSTSIRVKGLKNPFVLEQATLSIKAGRLQHMSVTASGTLPRLLNDAPVKLAMTFVQNTDGKVDLDQMNCSLGDKDQPIFTRGTRFRFDIQKLDMRYARETPNADRHFYFEVTGSAQFTPDGGEFNDGLLEDLKSARIEFIKAPLTDEFHKSLSAVVELKRPVEFEVFKLFRMEIRSIGFAPTFKEFAEEGPAIIIGGQCEFAKFGDVVSAKVDFHRMYLGFPKSGESKPQVHFNGLRVEISSAEGFKIAGRVDSYDNDKLKGFAGEGTVAIPGLPELSAAMSFVRLRESPGQPWRHGWFIAIEASKISIQITPLPIFLRQIGAGFGYRYTLPLIRQFQEQPSIRELLRIMMEALNRHQSLARIDSWIGDPSRDDRRALWTIALEVVATLGTSQKGYFNYNSKDEKGIKTLIVQLLAAFRSDFTLVAAGKVWFPVSVDDFFENLENMRNRPLVSGFMIYSAPQNRFLAHAAKHPDPYMGPKDDPVPEFIKDILRKVHYEATILIEPGLFHAELGWPDRLIFKFEIAGLSIECRGGVLFRIERDVLIQGTYFSGRGVLDLSGGVDLGFVGVRIEARADIQMASRMLTAQYPFRPLSNKIYSATGYDIAVRFSLTAWLRLKIGFIKISINISFSFSIQIAVAVEWGWAGGANLGFRARANVLVSVFGRQLGISIAVGVNEGGVDKAREVLGPYMGSLLEAGKAPPMPGFDKVGLGERGAAAQLNRARRPAMLTQTKVDTANGFVLAHLERAPDLDVNDGKTTWFVMILPGPTVTTCYPPTGAQRPDSGDEANPCLYAKLDFTSLKNDNQLGEIEIYTHSWTSSRGKPGDPLNWTGSWTPVTDATPEVEVRARATRALESEMDAGSEGVAMTVDKLIAGCWELEDPEAMHHELFPAYWTEKLQDEQYIPPLVAPRKITGASPALVDERVYVMGGPARKSTYARDPNHPYDTRLEQALATSGNGSETILTPAHGNQGLLLQAYQDALVHISGKAKVSKPLHGAFAVEIPGLETLTVSPLDIGMLFCVRAKEKPAWLADRKSGLHPKLKFVTGHGSLGADYSFDLRPAIRAELLDFKKNPPRLVRFATYHDEDAISVAFEFDWGGNVRPEDFAGQPKKPPPLEHFVQAFEIALLDRDDGRQLGRPMTVAPTELLTPSSESSDALEQTRTRYQYSVPTQSVLGPETLAQSGRVRNIDVVVTPISQSGVRSSRSVTDSIVFEPSLTPLPPDRAELILEPKAPKAKVLDSKALDCSISWRSLSLPPRPGIASTKHWQLILRPLRETPLGSWPDEMFDLNDRGLMSVTGQTLLPGDIIVTLENPKKGEKGKKFFFSERKFEAEEIEADQREGRDPADKLLVLDLGAEFKPKKLHLYDHLGRELVPDDPAAKEALGFFGRSPAYGKDGRAWRLFLRASSQPLYMGKTNNRVTGPLQMTGLSGLATVQLFLSMPAEKLKTKSGEARADASARRHLPHFEWPDSRDPVPVQLTRDQLPRELNADFVMAGTIEKGDNGQLQLHFKRRHATTRVLTLEWSTLQAQNTGLPPEAFAAYDLFELRLDTLLNADTVAKSGFLPEWRHLKRVTPSHPVMARQTPLTMSDTPNWESQTPAFARTIKFLEDEGVEPGDWPQNWPGWWSWAESSLCWPPTQAFGAIPQPQDIEKVPDATPGENQSEWIAYWRELGQRTVGFRLHDYLATIIGCLAETGTKSNTEGVTFNVEIIAGPSSSITDPLQWLAANTAAVDPYGWAALSRLGLSLMLSLRDTRTSLPLAPDVIHAAVEKACDQVAEATRNLRVASSVVMHLFIDLPLQNARAYRSTEATVSLADAGLSLLQLSLRPLVDKSLAAQRYEVFRLAKKSRDYTAFENSMPTKDVEIVIANASRPSFILKVAESLSPERLQQLFREGDEVIARRANGDSGSLATALKDAFTVIPVDDLYVKQPLPMLQIPKSAKSGRNDMLRHLSPFGRFQPRIDDWRNQLVDGGTQEVAQSFTRFLDYVTEAFRKTEDPQIPAWRVLARVDDGKEGLEDDTPGSQRVKLVAAYLGWSARFFEVAPLNPPDSRRERADWQAVAQPKTSEPSRVAADGRGQLTYLHFIEEELAGLRSYAIMAVGRYDRFWKALDGSVEANSENKSDEQTEPMPYQLPSVFKDMVDVKIPRIRRLEPPRPLLARVLKGKDGRQFNEVVVAHSERELSMVPSVAWKLEFGELLHRHDREFRDYDWVDQLKKIRIIDMMAEGQAKSPLLGNDWAPALPAPLERNLVFGDGEPSQDGNDSLLAHSPEARWGASRYSDAAEPFYYIQSVTLEATAGANLRSEAVTVTLPAHDPDELAPMANEPSEPSTIKDLQWSGVDLVVDEFRQKLSNMLAHPPHPSEDLIRARLNPMGYSVCVRLPRYVESLHPERRDQEFAYETKTFREKGKAPLGLLPDQRVRTLLRLHEAGTSGTLLELAPRQSFRKDGTDWREAFSVSAPLTDYVAEVSGIEAKDWPTGMVATINARPSMDTAWLSHDIGVLLAELSAANHIAEPDPSAGDLGTFLAADAFPKVRSLMQLAPLALRLTQTWRPLIKPGFGLLSPLIGPAWLTQPSRSVDGTDNTKLSAADLEIGIRLMADIGRRRAAAILWYDQDNAHDGGQLDWVSEAGELARLIEQATFARLLYWPKAFNLGDLLKFDILNKLSVSFWRRTRSEDSSIWRWVKLDSYEISKPFMSDDSWLIVVIEPNFDADTTQILQSVIVHLGRDDSFTSGMEGVTLDQIKKTRIYFTELSRLAWRGRGMPKPEVLVQRGNEVPIAWTTKKPAHGGIE